MSDQCEMTDYCPLCRVYNRLASSEAGRHLLNAKRELLLALKALMEGEIAKTTQKGASKRAQKMRIG